LIELKSGHPTGRMRRAGIIVERVKPAVVDDVPLKVAKEPFFVISDVTEEKLKKLADFWDYRAKKEMTPPVEPKPVEPKPKKGK
jgi:hypothetical protein